MKMIEDGYQKFLVHCRNRLLENTIVVVDCQRDLNSDHDLDNLLIDIAAFNNEDDFLDAEIKVEAILDENKEIVVLSPELNPEMHFSRNNVKIVGNLTTFIHEVIYSDSDHTDNIFFRGHGYWGYDLVPSIYREDNKHILDNESKYIREIISSYPKYFEGCKSALDYLSVLQHHEFPTRLLDFSENPLIALYMACNDELTEHADVLRIAVPQKSFKFYDSDVVSVLSNLAFADDCISVTDWDFKKTRKEDFVEFNSRLEIKKLVHQIRNEKPYFKPEILPEHLDETVVFVKQKQEFDRINNQKGLFALFGMNRTKSLKPRFEFMNPPCDIVHLIIPASRKNLIIDELSRININEATVFGDMDHISNYYKQKDQRHISVERERKAFK